MPQFPPIGDDEGVQFINRFAPITKPVPIPETDIFDQPTVCITFNEQWVSHVIGVLDVLDQPDAWKGTEAEIDACRQNVRELILALMGGNCVAVQFRFTAECGLEYSNNAGVDWLPVDGWAGFAAECFTGEDGAPGATGPAGADSYLRENLPVGLEQDDNPLFTSPTLVHAYYRADALRSAVRFYARDNAASLLLKNAADTQKLALGIVGTQNEFDMRESKMLIRYGAGALNTRQMYFNDDGTIQIVNSVIAPTAKFSTYMDRSTEDGVHIEGRTGLNTDKAVLNIRSNNQSGGVNDGYAVRIRGVNDATYTLAPGIFGINRYGEVEHGAVRTSRQLTAATPKVTRAAFREETSLLSESGANYRSLVAMSAYKNGVVATPSLQMSVNAADEPMIAFNGRPAIPKALISGSAEGNQLLFDITAALADVGLIGIVSVELGENCCAEIEGCKIYDFTVAPYNSDWNIIDGQWIDGSGYAPQAATDAIRLNMLFDPDLEITYIRIAGTNPGGVVGPSITVDLDSVEIFSFGPAAITPWFGSSTFDPDEVGELLEIEIICDIDDPVFLTTIEIHYREDGGIPSGGISCDA